MKSISDIMAEVRIRRAMMGGARVTQRDVFLSGRPAWWSDALRLAGYRRNHVFFGWSIPQRPFKVGVTSADVEMLEALVCR